MSNNLKALDAQHNRQGGRHRVTKDDKHSNHHHSGQACGTDQEKLLNHGSQDLCDAVEDKTVSLADAVAICEADEGIQNEAVRRVLYGHFLTVQEAVQVINAELQDRDIKVELVADVNGVKVSGTLREYFDATILFDEAMALAKSLRLKLNELDRHPISNYRERSRLQGFCKSIEAAMATERFGMMCPACEGIHEGNCNCCRNVRWFNVAMMTQVDLKKWRKKP